MKLLRVISSTNPEAGGVIEAVNQTSIALKTLDITTEVLCSDPINAEWLNKFDFPVYAVGKGKTKYSYQPQLKKWLIQNVHHYTHVIIDGIWQYHSFATWQICKKLQLDYSVYTHGMLDPWFKKQYPLKHLKKWLFWPWSDYRVLRDATHVLFTCEEERELAEQSFWLYKANGSVAPIGTSHNKCNLIKSKISFEERFPRCKNKRNILYLSRIHPKKGCDLLIKAFANIFKNNPDYHLIMAGPDQVGWMKELEALAKKYKIDDQITWTGMIKDEMKFGAFHAAEAFILPSHQENFGIAITEALACGTPVLLSNKVNIWREIIGENAGFVENDDLSGTENLLSRWKQLKNSEKASIAKNAERCFGSHFEINKATKNLIELL